MDFKDFKLPSFMIKKIFPPKKCLFTVDINGDGKADAVQIKILNVIQPFSVPEKIELGDIDIDEVDPSEYGKLLLDDESIDISKDSSNINLLKESLRVQLKGETANFKEILSGKFGGKTFAMGDSIDVVFKLDDSFLAKLTEGKHTLTVVSDKIPTVEINFELTKKNMNQKLTL